VSSKNLIGYSGAACLHPHRATAAAIRQALGNNASYIMHDLTLARIRMAGCHLRCAATPLQSGKCYLLLEFHPMTPAETGARRTDASTRPRLTACCYATWRMK